VIVAVESPTIIEILVLNIFKEDPIEIKQVIEKKSVKSDSTTIRLYTTSDTSFILIT